MGQTTSISHQLACNEMTLCLERYIYVVTLAIIAMASTQSYSTDVPMYHITWQGIFYTVNCKDLTAFTLHELLRLINLIVQLLLFQCIKLACCCGIRHCGIQDINTYSL